MAVLCSVMAKPTVFAYSAPLLAEPASAVIESTYHGVSGAYYATPVATAFSAPYVSAYPYSAAYTTLFWEMTESDELELFIEPNQINWTQASQIRNLFDLVFL